MTKTIYPPKKVHPPKSRRLKVQFTTDTDLNPRGKALTKTGLRQIQGTSDQMFVTLVKLKKMTTRYPSSRLRLPEKVRQLISKLGGTTTLDKSVGEPTANSENRQLEHSEN